MKQLGIVAALLLWLGACGGGGGADGGNVQNPPPPDPTPPQLVASILDACNADDVGQTLSIQERILDLLGGGATAPDFSITGIQILQASFSWSLDLDGDQAPDLAGTTQFLDAGGAPRVPVANVQDLLDALGGDITALGQVLTQVPAGTQVRTTYSGSPGQLPATTIDGAVTIVADQAGSFTRSSGFYRSQTGQDCASEIDWADLDIGDVATGGRPRGVLGVEASSPTHVLDGSLTLDGSDTGVLEVGVDGAPPVTYTLDLTTGAVS